MDSFLVVYIVYISVFEFNYHYSGTFDGSITMISSISV